MNRLEAGPFSTGETRWDETYSEPEFGTTFKIYLPRVESEIRAIRQPHSVEHVTSGCETLLLVEDEAVVRRSTREFLAATGYIVLEAENGRHALKIAREFESPIHLMITDVVMPQLGCAGFASQLAVDARAVHLGIRRERHPAAGSY